MKSSFFVIYCCYYSYWILKAYSIRAATSDLPSCDLTNIDMTSSYQENHQLIEQCGLPSSKSYLFSKYNMLLVADKHTSSTGVFKKKNQDKMDLMTIQVKGCIPTKEIRNKLYKDNQTFQKFTQMTIKDCLTTEINLWARVTSKTRIELATITKSQDTCEWTISFQPKETGIHTVEIINTWLGGSTEPVEKSVVSTHEWRGVHRSGGTPYEIPPSLFRGSRFVPCHEKCNVYDHCAFYTYEAGTRQCQLFTSKTLPNYQKKGIGEIGNETTFLHPVSGGRMEPYSPHLGGKVISAFKTAEEIRRCHQQAHVYRSPQVITIGGENIEKVQSHSQSQSTSLSPIVECKRVESLGLWKKIDLLPSDCPNAPIDELEIMARDSVAISEETGSNDSILIQKMYHKNTDSTFFSMRDSSSITYSWNPPKNHASDSRHSQAIPPWQLNPRCSLVSRVVPINPTNNNSKNLTFGGTSGRGFEWVGVNSDTQSECRYKYFSRHEMKQCMLRKNLTDIYFSGDSIIGGISTMIKWLLGAKRLRKNTWYAENSTKHAISSDFAPLTSSRYVSFQNLDCKLNNYDTCLKSLRSVNSGIYLVNLHVQHLIWGYTMKEIDDFGKALFGKIKQMIKSNEISPNLKVVLITSMAVHGFRELHCTLPRSERVSQILGNYAKSVGWKIIDAYNMTVSRREMSFDGMHYNDEMNFMFCQMIFNSLCLES